MVVPAASAAAPEPPEADRLDSTTVFQREFRYIWNTVRRLGVHERDLEDVTHEVFVRVHDQLPLFDEARALRPWLFGIALGVTTNYRRLARHRVDLVAEVPERSDPSGAADEVLLQRERVQLVHAALQQVPLEQRAVLVLHELDGCSIPDVATTLGLTLNTAYSRLRLGREAFRAALRRLASRKGFR
jgi:RNA polymerase sigma-70 factor (ECF subfamily)